MTVDPWKLADELKEMQEMRVPYERQIVVEIKLAKLFAERMGWQWTQRSFDVGDMCRVPSLERSQFYSDYHEFHYHGFDHSWFYRAKAINSRHSYPVAIVAHPYDFNKTGRADCEELVRRQPRLMFTHVTDFPSWWLPGYTELLVWQYNNNG